MRDTIIISGGLVDTPYVEQQGYEYRRHAKLGFLSDALWWALGKLGCLRAHLQTIHQWRFEGHTKKPEMLEAIYQAVDIEEVYHRRGDFAIVMGIDDYMRLMSQSRDNLPTSGFQFVAGPFGYRGETFGLPVHVVTTLSGIAAIPRVIVEQRAAR